MGSPRAVLCVSLIPSASCPPGPSRFVAGVRASFLRCGQEGCSERLGNWVFIVLEERMLDAGCSVSQSVARVPQGRKPCPWGHCCWTHVTAPRGKLSLSLAPVAPGVTFCSPGPGAPQEPQSCPQAAARGAGFSARPAVGVRVWEAGDGCQPRRREHEGPASRASGLEAWGPAWRAGVNPGGRGVFPVPRTIGTVEPWLVISTLLSVGTSASSL